MGWTPLILTCIWRRGMGSTITTIMSMRREYTDIIIMSMGKRGIFKSM